MQRPPDRCPWPPWLAQVAGLPPCTPLALWKPGICWPEGAVWQSKPNQSLLLEQSLGPRPPPMLSVEVLACASVGAPMICRILPRLQQVALSQDLCMQDNHRVTWEPKPIFTHAEPCTRVPCHIYPYLPVPYHCTGTVEVTWGPSRGVPGNFRDLEPPERGYKQPAWNWPSLCALTSRSLLSPAVGICCPPHLSGAYTPKSGQSKVLQMNNLLLLHFRGHSCLLGASNRSHWMD